MIVLTSTEKLQLVLSAGTADVDVNYNDRTPTAYGPSDSQQTAATAATQDICTAPAASTSREINGLSVSIKTTGGNVTLQKVNSTGPVTTIIVPATTLAVGDRLELTHGNGLKVSDASGQIKVVMPGYLPLTGGTLTGALIPSQTLGITGTTTNNNANTGAVGEYVSSTVLVGAAVPLTTATAADITSISLTAGDWDVWGTVVTNPNAATTQTVIVGWVSSTSATIPTAPNEGGEHSLNVAIAAGQTIILSCGMRRFSLSGTTIIYLSIFSAFAVNTNAGYGFIGARRMR